YIKRTRVIAEKMALFESKSWARHRTSLAISFRSARSPWQNCDAERVIGTIRRECSNHTIVINEGHLRRILKSYFSYYHRSRTHLSLDDVTPDGKLIRANATVG